MTIVSREEIEHIVGRGSLDDTALAAIIGTGASKAEVIEAHERLAKGQIVGKETGHAPGPVVEAVLEILAEATGLPEDRERD